MIELRSFDGASGGTTSKCPVPKAMLRKWSFFKDHRDLNTKIILLDPMPKLAFGLFVKWLDEDSLPEISMDDEKYAKSQVETYVSLYVNARNWGMCELRNHIIDRIAQRDTCEGGWFPKHLVKELWQATPNDDKLRKFVIDQFVYKSEDWCDKKFNDVMEGHQAYGNIVFVLDCFKAVRSSLLERVPDPRSNPLETGHEEYYVYPTANDEAERAAKKPHTGWNTYSCIG